VLDVVGEALKFVSEIYMGDNPPPEIVTGLEDLRRFSNEHVNQGKIAQAPNWLHTNVDGESQGLTRIQPVLKEFAKELSYIEVQRETIG
jgi:hypothetical protein